MEYIKTLGTDPITFFYNGLCTRKLMLLTNHSVLVMIILEECPCHVENTYTMREGRDSQIIRARVILVSQCQFTFPLTFNLQTFYYKKFSKL